MMHHFTRKPQPQRLFPQRVNSANSYYQQPAPTESFDLFSQNGGSLSSNTTPRSLDLSDSPDVSTESFKLPPKPIHYPRQSVKLASLFTKRGSTNSLMDLPIEAMSIAPPVSSPHSSPGSVTKEPRRHSNPLPQRYQKNKENFMVNGLNSDLVREGTNGTMHSVISLDDDAFSSHTFMGERKDPINKSLDREIHEMICQELSSDIYDELMEASNDIRREIEKDIHVEIHREMQEIQKEKHPEAQEITTVTVIEENIEPSKAEKLKGEKLKAAPPSKSPQMVTTSTQTIPQRAVLPSANNFPVQITTTPPQFELKEPEGQLKEILALKSKYLVPWSLLELTTLETRWEFIQTIEKGVRDISLRYGLPDGDKTVINIYMTLSDDFTGDSLNDIDTEAPAGKKITECESLTQLSQALNTHTLDMVNTLTEFKLMILLKGIPPLLIHTWTKQILNTISSYSQIQTHEEFMDLVRWISDRTIVLQFIPTKTIHDLLVFSNCLSGLKNEQTFTKDTNSDVKIGRWLTSLQKLAMVQPLKFFRPSKKAVLRRNTWTDVTR